jgi:amino-acid N-acetyltransferase
MSVLEAQPSARDSRSYLKAFAPPRVPHPRHSANSNAFADAAFPHSDAMMPTTAYPRASTSKNVEPSGAADARYEDLDSIIHPVHHNTALVKIQGPFTDRQLTSIAEGMVYLRKLGLVSIIVMDSEEWATEALKADDEGRSKVREAMVQATMRFAELLEDRGCAARPLTEGVVRVRRDGSVEHDTLDAIRSAVLHDEMPVISPVAVDEALRLCAVNANDAIKALAVGLCRHTSVEKAVAIDKEADPATKSGKREIDLTPVRLMIINREGGVPSHARGGDPHLSINLQSEYEYIKSTFVWSTTHPTALSNLDLARSCLSTMPRSSSAVVVSHRSPKALIANLITNRPAHSPSLHHSLLPHNNIQHTPSIVRYGLPIRVIRDFSQLSLPDLTRLLEASFGKKLDERSYYARLERSLDFAIIAGDYEGAAIVTDEGRGAAEGGGPIAYLDKFSVLPSLQGDGTVDFLWGALRDESFGLGLLDSLNNNGGREGRGEGRDLVWRSRRDNPVNKWYFERSNGFARIEMGTGGAEGLMFWCDAEDRLERVKREAESGQRDGRPGWILDEEKQRLERWTKTISAIKSCWLP